MVSTRFDRDLQAVKPRGLVVARSPPDSGKGARARKKRSAVSAFGVFAKQPK